MTRTLTTMGDLRDLAPLAKKVNSATDELNLVLETIQSRLNDLGIGVEAWLNEYVHQELSSSVDRLSSGDYERHIDAEVLGYYRFEDGWGFAVRSQRYRQTKDIESGEWDVDDEGDEGPVYRSPRPLLRASRATRVRAVELIPKLIDEIKAEAEKILSSVDAAKKIAESLK